MQVQEDLAKDEYGIAYVAGGEAWVTPRIKTAELGVKTLSRDGQELVMKDGKYLPLTAVVVREERKKLDREMRP